MSDFANKIPPGGTPYPGAYAGSGGGTGTVTSVGLTKTNDTNVTATVTGSPVTAAGTINIAIGWTGTLAAARLNANVVQGVTNDTNVTGTIAAQVVTLGWTGTLAVARGGTGAGTLTGILKGNGTSAVTAVALPADATKYLDGTGAFTVPAASSGDATRAAIQAGSYVYAADTSSSTTTYTASLTPALSAYTTGMIVIFVPANSNTGASTLNINGLGAKAIIAANTTGSALTSDDLIAAGVYILEYDGTSFRKIDGPDGAWTGLSYSNSWSDNGGGYQVGQYRKLRNGNVEVRGQLLAGTKTAGTTIFTLPAGYRPPSITILPAFNGGPAGAAQPVRLSIATNGATTNVEAVGTDSGFSVNGWIFSVY